MKKLILTAVFIYSVAASAAFAADICSRPVETAEGPVVGMSEKKVESCAWKGIPYAAPPVGELRWKPPIPAAKRSGTLEAYEFSAECSQMEMIPRYLMFGKKPNRSEDCLYLNVWRPKKEGKFPVMVWIHGGALNSGTGSSPMYWGDRIAEARDVVLVTINYRLAAFGFMGLPGLSAEDGHGSSGSYGLLDQIAALRWVNENIAGFGGDPGNVTIFGESAGGWSICYQLASPLSKGLFHKAIIQSGGCDTVNTREKDFKNGAEFAAKFDCYGDGAHSCMRKVSAEKIVEIMGTNEIGDDEDMKIGKYDHKWAPQVDGWSLEEVPIEALRSGRYNQVPLMAGSTRDEFKLFVVTSGFRKKKEPELVRMVINSIGKELFPEFQRLYPFEKYRRPADAVIDAMGDVGLGCKTYEAALASTKFKPTYYYRFDYDEHRLPNMLGAAHSFEIPFIFNSLDRPFYTMLFSRRQRKKARHLVASIMSYWTNFAATGEPGEGGMIQWPAFDADKQLRMYLDLPIHVEKSDNRKKCEFWRKHEKDIR